MSNLSTTTKKKKVFGIERSLRSWSNIKEEGPNKNITATAIIKIQTKSILGQHFYSLLAALDKSPNTRHCVMRPGLAITGSKRYRDEILPYAFKVSTAKTTSISI